MKIMKILHFATTVNGGAGIACQRLCRFMEDHGYTADIVTMQTLPKPRSLIHRIIRRFWRTWEQIQEKRLKRLYPSRFGNWNNLYGIRRISEWEQIEKADVIYLHWINQMFLPLTEIQKILKTGKPVFWFLHDMWPLCGGCHYSFSCSKYQTHCAHCELLQNHRGKDLSWKNFEQKLQVFSGVKNLHIITPSHWLADCTRRSALFKDKTIDVIPNLLDFNLFHPLDKQAVRTSFNIPLQKKVILFGANGGLQNPYKGGSYLLEALQKLDLSDKILLIFGSSENKEIREKLNADIRFLGHVQQEWAMNLIYNLADVFITPSLADNFPNTILESMVVGVPCVAFNIGGIPDLIIHKQNGYLAEYKKSDDLAFGIRWILDNPQYDRLSKSATAHVKKLCDSAEILKKHEMLWKRYC